MQWNTQKKIWQLSTADQLLEQWELFSETWPTSGMTQDGQVFELQTQAHLISDSEFSSLPTPLTTEHKANASPGALRRKTQQLTTVVHSLPTPNTMDGLPPRSAEARERQLYRGGSTSKRSSSGNLREDILQILPTPRAQEPGSTSQGYGDSLNDFAQRVTKGYAPKDLELLRSPTASQGEGGALGEETARARGNTIGIRDQAMDIAALNLLPTTRTSMANGASQKELNAGNPKGRLETVTNWGKFEPAIRRWEETIGRHAPAPTKPDGKDGNHRLSSAFTEWMMGLPEGWITDVGLKRNEELKACGNGVVPQQAELALRILLEGIEIEAGGVR
jgi:DNA (cytosine-5)-methyltransferase 1